MASEIELAAEQVLGAGALPRNNRMFDPISLPSGLDSRDYLRISQQSMADDSARRNIVSSAMQDRLKQENVFRQLEASKQEQSALQELYRLDTFDPEFNEKADMYTELAAYSPRVANALQAKRNRFNQEAAALSGVSSALAVKRAKDEEIRDSLAVARELLRTRGANSSMFLRWKTGLARDAGLKELEEKQSFQTSRSGAAKALEDYGKGLATLQESVNSKLLNIPNLPESWSERNIMDIGFPEQPPEEEVTINKDNVDLYDVDPQLSKKIKGQDLTSTGAYRKRMSDPQANVISSYGFSPDQEEKALELIDRGADVDSFTTNEVFNSYVIPPGQDKPKSEEFKKYWESNRGQPASLSDGGERYKKNREATLSNLHSQLKAIDEVPLQIQKFFNSSSISRKALQEYFADRTRRAATAAETGIDVSGEGSTQVDDYINQKINSR